MRRLYGYDAACTHYSPSTHGATKQKKVGCNQAAYLFSFHLRELFAHHPACFADESAWCN